MSAPNMSVCNTTPFTPEGYALLKYGELPSFDWTSETALSKIPYVPSGKTLGETLKACGQLKEFRNRSASTAKARGITHNEWVELMTDRELSTQRLDGPCDTLVRMEKELTESTVNSTREWRENPSIRRHVLPSYDELCLTADDQFGYVLWDGFPTRCTRPGCNQLFRTGQAYDKRTGQHRTINESGLYDPEFSDRYLIPGPTCTGCQTVYTSGPILTDCSGTNWYHLKWDDQGRIRRCGYENRSSGTKDKASSTFVQSPIDSYIDRTGISAQA